MTFACRMRSAAAIVVAFGLTACAASPPPELGPVPARVQSDVAFIGGVQQEGRAVGTPGSNRVANYLADEYRALALRGAFWDVCRTTACNLGYFQPFTRPNARNAKNVGAVIVGSDPALRDEYIVIGAHYDHVGRSATLSLDPEKRDEIRPGADDNASGTAAVLELARRFAAKPARRSILLLNFDAEEVGLIGSAVFVATPPVPARRMKLMINLDMVGRLRSNGLEIDKAGLVYDDPALLAVADSVAKALRIPYKYTNKIDGRSDHVSFRRIDVSALALFTGYHDDYHRATDIVARLDVRGIGRVADVAEAMVRFAADRE